MAPIVQAHPGARPPRTTAGIAPVALEARDLHLSYDGTPVLRGLSLNVGQGEIYALLGGNGAGKSSTVNVFLGFARLTAGQALICGCDVQRDPLRARSLLAYVPENVALYEHLSARENLAYFLRLAGADADTDSIAQALHTAGLGEAAWNRKLAGYSKGMRQKTAIALALARSVSVLLLDEPNTGLDPQATADFNTLLQALRAKGVSIFMVTHDLLSAAEVADRIGFLAGGQIAEEFSADGPERFDVRELYRRYKTWSDTP